MVFFSCKEEKVVRVYDENGNLQAHWQIDKDSLKVGYLIKLYENGDTLEFSTYKNDKLEGVRKLYYSDNKIEIEENYTDGQLHGNYKVYYPNGFLKIASQYVSNRLEGLLKKYGANGSLEEEVTFINNEENGPFTEFYSDGIKKWEGFYKDGPNEVGILIHYAPNGDTIKKMNCDERSICITIWKNEKYREDESF